jgi:hypothetical protein
MTQIMLIFTDKFFYKTYLIKYSYVQICENQHYLCHRRSFFQKNKKNLKKILQIQNLFIIFFLVISLIILW